MIARLKKSKEELFTIQYMSYFIWLSLLMLFAYLTLIAIFNDEALPPDGHLFHMFCLFILAHFMGKLFHIINLPSLLGMLAAGILYGNIVNFEINKKFVSTIRSTALLTILLRAGLHLNPEYLRYLSFSIIRVILIPFFTETFTVSLFSMLLFNFNFMWSLLIGFVLAAVSPAVIVPCMIRIEQKKLSEGKNIPTLNIAASSINDVLSVTGFNIFLLFAITNKKSESFFKSETMKILQGPLQIVIGIIFGVVMGFILWYIPENHNKNSKKYDLPRFLLLLIAGIFALFGSIYIEMEASGPIGVLIMTFIAKIKWRNNEWDEANEHNLKIIWLVFKRLLFCLIGCELKFKTLDAETVGFAIICLFMGIIFKIIISYLMTFDIGLNKKERLFVSFSWVPKATVQAAIGPAALQVAETVNDIKNGKIILTAAALSILITAPLGAIVIDFLCNRLLTKPDINTNNVINDNKNNNLNNNNVIVEKSIDHFKNNLKHKNTVSFNNNDIHRSSITNFALCLDNHFSQIQYRRARKSRASLPEIKTKKFDIDLDL